MARPAERYPQEALRPAVIQYYLVLRTYAYLIADTVKQGIDLLNLPVMRNEKCRNAKCLQVGKSNPSLLLANLHCQSGGSSDVRPQSVEIGNSRGRDWATLIQLIDGKDRKIPTCSLDIGPGGPPKPSWAQELCINRMVFYFLFCAVVVIGTETVVFLSYQSLCPNIPFRPSERYHIRQMLLAIVTSRNRRIACPARINRPTERTSNFSNPFYDRRPKLRDKPRLIDTA